MHAEFGFGPSFPFKLLIWAENKPLYSPIRICMSEYGYWYDIGTRCVGVETALELSIGSDYEYGYYYGVKRWVM